MKKGSKMSENKIRKAFWLSEDAYQKIELNSQLDDSRSRSEFLENAINYYSIYLNTENNQDIVAEIFVKIFEAKLKGTENRISNLLFKNAVEQAKISNILAFISEIDDETLEKLHKKCVDEVKRTNGKLTLEKVIKYQRENY